MYQMQFRIFIRNKCKWGIKKPYCCNPVAAVVLSLRGLINLLIKISSFLKILTRYQKCKDDHFTTSDLMFASHYIEIFTDHYKFLEISFLSIEPLRKALWYISSILFYRSVFCLPVTHSKKLYKINVGAE